MIFAIPQSTANVIHETLYVLYYKVDHQNSNTYYDYRGAFNVEDDAKAFMLKEIVELNKLYRDHLSNNVATEDNYKIVEYKVS